MSKYCHVTRDGTEIELCNLEMSHLKNIIRFIERKAQDGLMIVLNGSFGFFDPTEGDVDYIYGDKVKERMGYRFYVEELNRRLANKSA